MPPRVTVEKQELLEVGLTIIRKSGFENVNARSLAKELSCSTHPIFRLYKNMTEIKADLFTQAENYCNAYLEKRMTAYPQNMVFGIGMAYIDLASQEPNVFKFLFMNNHFRRKEAQKIWESEENAPILHGIAASTGISFTEAQSLFQKLWLLTHGIASLTATSGQLFTTEEITQILKEAFTGFLSQIKHKGGNPNED